MSRRTRASRAAGLAVLLAALGLAAVGDEAPPRLVTATLLSPAERKGAHHEVAETVATPGYFHEFTVSSPYGAFTAVGRSQLTVRILEIEALAALDDVSKTEVFLSAAGRSVVNVGKGAAKAVTDPAATAKGIGAGVKRFCVNLGRRTQRALDKDGEGEAAGAEEAKKESGAERAANSVLGVTAATRRWAQKLGVDPYTTNAVLRQALEEVGKVDTAGSIATKVALPVPAVVGVTAGVGNLVWGKDPEEVRKVNEQRLREIGVADDVARRLFRSAWFTLTAQTRLVAALHAVRVPGCADYVASAAEAQNEREALFFAESAELLQRWAARERVTRILPDSRALVATDGTGRATVLLPLDWIRLTAANEAVLRQIANRATSELSAGRLEVSVTGSVTPQMTRALSDTGWTVRKVQPGPN
jgi:hypothetical protein